MFVERLDRSTVERAITDLAANDDLPYECLLTDDEEDDIDEEL